MAQSHVGPQSQLPHHRRQIPHVITGPQITLIHARPRTPQLQIIATKLLHLFLSLLKDYHDGKEYPQHETPRAYVFCQDQGDSRLYV